MKKIILNAVLTFIMPVVLSAATAQESKIFTPYFDMSLTEAGYIPSKGNLFAGSNINTNVGFLTNITAKDQLFGLYTFNYAGKGFTPQDSKQFTDRTLAHSFNFEYRRSFGALRLRPGISFSKDYSRAGANSAWEDGLYNTKTNGYQFAGDYMFDSARNGIITITWLKKNVEFPNYTDLLAEFNNPSNTANANGGLQDQKLKMFSIRPSWNKFFGGITSTTQDFDNQKVVENSGAYGNRLQEDKTTTLDFGFQHTWWIFELYPTISYTKHKSNQNFMRYKFYGATAIGDGSADVHFVANNYDYNETAFILPVDLNITSKWAIGGSLNVLSRKYTDRPRRDENDNYIEGTKQTNKMTTLTGSIRKHINDVASIRFFYSFVVASSNCKFERYMPYNYTGNSFGISYQLSY